MKICVIGLGYIGLPTAAMFADAGFDVLGVDKAPAVVEALNRGEIIIEEKGLAEFVKKVVSSGRLRAAQTPESCDVYIIAVPTPISPDKKADMRFVESATLSVAPLLKKGDLVVLESTSPVGTVDGLMLPILEGTGLKAGRDFGLGHSPERVIPGKILQELVNNDRIAGGVDRGSAKRIKELYGSFVKGHIYETDARTAEMCKLSENTFRDVNIAFANELAKICEGQGINVWELIELCNKHPRVNIHQPGPGVGGHCIAVDPWFIVEKEPGLANIIKLSRDTNDSMPAFVAEKTLKMLAGVEDPLVCVLGVTYKPDVDDMRESPIKPIVAKLKAAGCRVNCHDPHVGGQEGVELSLEKAAAGADLLLLGVNHREYADLDFEALGAFMRSRNFLDTRNCADRKACEQAGFTYGLLGS